MSEEERDPLFQEFGKSSQLPQYDDITFRRMEAVNANANLRTWSVFQIRGLYNAILIFHQCFGALVDSTLLEVIDEGGQLNNKKRHLSEEDEKRIRAFLKNPFEGVEIKGSDVESSDNRTSLKRVGEEANAIHEIYEIALKKAGYRKISYSVLRPEKKYLENR